MTSTAQPAQVCYEMPAPNIARIVLNRAKKRNAQGMAVTYQLETALAANKAVNGKKA